MIGILNPTDFVIEPKKLQLQEDFLKPQLSIPFWNG